MATNRPPVRRKRDRRIQTPVTLESWLEKRVFFDWYAFTLPNPLTGKGELATPADSEVTPDEIDETATRELLDFAIGCHSLYSSEFDAGQGTKGYSGRQVMRRRAIDRESVGAIYHHSKSAMPMLEFTGGGGACKALAQAAREHFGDRIRISRADVSLDLTRPLLYDTLLAMAHEMAAARRGMKPPTEVGNVEDGRTFYIGSLKSRVRLKVYEKDLERVARKKLAPDAADRNLVRIEVTFRPKSTQKAGFGKLSPTEMIRTSVWVRRFLEQLARLSGVAAKDDKLAPAAVETEVRTRTKLDSAIHGLKQYRNSFLAVAADRIVERQFAGDYCEAVIDVPTLADEAAAWIKKQMVARDQVQDFIYKQGLYTKQSPASRVEWLLEAMDSEVSGRLAAEETAANDMIGLLASIASQTTTPVVIRDSYRDCCLYAPKIPGKSC